MARFDYLSTGYAIADEVINRSSSSSAKLAHDTIRGSTDTAIWTGAGGTGTKLTINTDYTLGEEDTRLSALVGQSIFTKLAVINGAYQNVNLYVTYKTVGDYAGTANINEIAGGSASSGSVGINLDNGQFEAGVVGWATYADTAGAAPVDGTGGSPAVTIAQNTTTPLFGAGDLLFTKDAANRQGQGVSSPFTIDAGAVGKAIRLDFSYKVHSGTYADNDMGIYIFDVTNAILIRPSVVDLVGGGGKVVDGTVEFFATTSSSYRLIFHIQSTSALAYALRLDNVRFSVDGGIMGSVVSDWQSYTPTFSAGFGTVTDINFMFRRVGSNMQIKGVWKNGTVAGTTASISLPVGHTAKVTVTGSAPAYGIAGTFQRGIAGATTPKAGVLAVANGESVMYWASSDYAQSGNPFFVAGAVSTLSTTGDYLTISADVPIAQWTANINLSSDFTEYAYNTSTTTADDITSFGYGPEGALIQAFAPSGNNSITKRVRFKRPVQPTDILALEVYTITNNQWTPMTNSALGGTYFRNDAGTVSFGCLLTATSTLTDVEVKFLSAPFTGGTWPAGTTYRWRVRKISNGNTAEVPPLVCAEMWLNADASASTGQPIQYSNIAKDTHGGCTTGSGARYTCRVAGRYKISVSVYSAATSGAAYLYKNGARHGQIAYTITTMVGSGTREIDLVPGDYVEIRMAGAMTMSGFASDAAYNWIQITRLGQ